MTRNELILKIETAAQRTTADYLTYAEFKRFFEISMNQVYKHFDSWTDACRCAGVQPGEASPSNITPRFSKGKEHALKEVVRVAKKLGASSLSKSQFDSQEPDIKAQTVANLWGGWLNALQAAGLDVHPNYRQTLGLDELSAEFLEVVRELGCIPTVNQISRRSQHGENTFTRKFGSYSAFKRKAIDLLLGQPGLSDDIRSLLDEHMRNLPPVVAPSQDLSHAPHQKGRHLGFRAFAFAPTYETEVVSMFGAVAFELGFEIVAQREAFPDCEARRKTNSSTASVKRVVA